MDERENEGISERENCKPGDEVDLYVHGKGCMEEREHWSPWEVLYGM